MRRALMVSVLLLGGSAYAAEDVSCTANEDYDNDCVAHKAGVSVAYVGSCCTQSQ